MTVFGEVNAACASSARVDSALPGSQDFASFFCTPLSLPASGPATATSTTQNRTTAYFILRPVRKVTTDLVMNFLRSAFEALPRDAFGPAVMPAPARIVEPTSRPGAGRRLSTDADHWPVLPRSRLEQPRGGEHGRQAEPEQEPEPRRAGVGRERRQEVEQVCPHLDASGSCRPFGPVAAVNLTAHTQPEPHGSGANLGNPGRVGSTGIPQIRRRRPSPTLEPSGAGQGPHEGARNDQQ